MLMRDGDQMNFMLLAQQTDLVESSELVSFLNRVRKTGCDKNDPHVVFC
jgi:hypothetical protein